VREKLAIVGCAPMTRDDIDYNDMDFDIWVFNESAQKDWCKRADAVFQIHQDSIWKNPMNRGDIDHGKWLMSGDTPTIYMLDKSPEVPKSVKFPTDEIVEKLLPGLTVLSERGRKDFFTSSIAYSFALGIYLGYKEIHTYGIELSDQIEYREQQPCAMFWIGIGVGLGVKWVSHSNMFDAPLYPLETFIGLDKEEFKKTIDELTPKCDDVQKEYIDVKSNTVEVLKRYEESGVGQEALIESIKKQAQVGQNFGVLDGARQENERYYNRARAMEAQTGTYIFSYHEFSRDQNAIGVRREETRKELLASASICQEIMGRIEPKIFDSERRVQFKKLREALDAYVKLAVMVGMYTGAINEDQKYMDKIQEALKNGTSS